MASAPREVKFQLNDVCEGKVVFLRSSDFKDGTYTITRPGIYVLDEDITFAPETPMMFPPKGSERYPASDGYFLGFFAAITIAADNVMIDLAGHTLKTSFEFCMRQRFFSLIQLANLPFNKGAGPPQFAALLGPLVPAHNVAIIDGNLGLSSHMAIHGNNNRNVWVSHVRIFDFETGGFQLNNASNVHMEHSCIGPSLGAPGSSHDVPSLGTLSHSVNLLRHTEGTPWEHQEEFRLLSAAVERFIDQRLSGKVPNPAAPFADPAWGYDGLPEGSAIYGFSVTPSGPAVGNFAPVEACTDVTGMDTVTLTNVTVRDLYLRTDEVIQLRDSKGRPIAGPAGDPMQVMRAQDARSGAYQGNVLTDAQAALGRLASEHRDLLKRNFTQYFELFGGSYVPEPVQAWVNGSIGFEKMVESLQGVLVCGLDAMSHNNKGVLAVRSECVDGLSFNRVHISNLFQQGKRSPFLPRCENRMETTGGQYNGDSARAVWMTGVPVWLHGRKPTDFNIKNVKSRFGRAIGVEVAVGNESVMAEALDGISVHNVTAVSHALAGLVMQVVR